MQTDIESFEGPAAWQSEQYVGTDWIDVLSPQHERELADAARALHGRVTASFSLC